MRSHVHPWLFAFLLLLGFEGPGANAADPGQRPSDPREADMPLLLAAPAALPACPWTHAEIGGSDLDRVPATLAAIVWVAARSSAGLHSRRAEWLSFRRQFADTVSYRTTAPPSRVA